jgi:membrane-bound lytic murein transglycosylase MltF
MKKRRIIRALVPHSKTFYYVEKGRQRGISYEVFKAFEDDLNRSLRSKALKVHVYFLPVGRDEIISRLVDGWGDVVFADLTITPERQKVVDFSAPMYTGINIYKYYTAYKLLVAQNEERRKAREEVKKPS